MSTQPLDWKNPLDVSAWRATRKKRIEEIWGSEFKPLLMGIPLAIDRKPEIQDPDLAEAIEQIQGESETIAARAHRLNGGDRGAAIAGPSGHTVPDLIGEQDGELILTPLARRADPWNIEKACAMYRSGIDRKAQRQLACHLLGAEIHCSNGHSFRAAYECGNRYCKVCGPKGANELFAKKLGAIRMAAAKLLDCGAPNCRVCDWWRDNPGKTKEREISQPLPHWPPPKGNRRRPRVVVAALDFTLRNTGETPEPWQLRQLNAWIKKWARAIERRFGVDRREYGIVFCDELGGNNTNMHAHAIYVGPWLPQEKRELSQLWAEVTRGAGLIVSIKYAESIERALYHAIKYPAKFAEKAAPARSAELESIFHRVRRVHALAQFYNAPNPDDELKDPGISRKCPACGERLSEPRWWTPLFDLCARGLRDVVELRREMERGRVLLGVGGSSP